MTTLSTETMGSIKQMALVETYTDNDGIIRVGESFPITPSFGVVWYRTLDFGFPDVRASSQDLPQASGTLDQTQYTGARSLSIEGVVIGDAFGSLPALDNWPTDVSWNSVSYFISYLSSWADPSRRYRIYFTDEIGRSRYMDVRGDSFSSALDGQSDQSRAFQLGMVNPSGRIYSFASGVGATVDGRYQVPIALSNIELAGRTYALTEPRTYPTPSSGAGRTEILYQGTVPNGFLIRIYTGSSTLAGLRVSVTGPKGTVQSIGLDPAYTVPVRTTVLIDTSARTVNQIEDNSSTLVSIEQYLAAPLQWPQLRPGINYSAPGALARRRGYNAFSFSSSTSPATDASFTAIYNHADLL